MTKRRDLLAAAALLGPLAWVTRSAQASEKEHHPPNAKHNKADFLFIDIIGMPLTPISYAGARRRAWRRAVIY